MKKDDQGWHSIGQLHRRAVFEVADRDGVRWFLALAQVEEVVLDGKARAYYATWRAYRSAPAATAPLPEVAPHMEVQVVVGRRHQITDSVGDEEYGYAMRVPGREPHVCPRPIAGAAAVRLWQATCAVLDENDAAPGRIS